MLVGGTTAVFADIQSAINHDYAVVFPVAALLIAAHPGRAALRSIVAPVYLVVVVLGFARHPRAQRPGLPGRSPASRA